MICWQGRNKVKVTEVAYCKESITPDNVYVIDNGEEIYQVIFLIDTIVIQLFQNYSIYLKAPCLKSLF